MNNKLLKNGSFPRLQILNARKNQHSDSFSLTLSDVIHYIEKVITKASLCNSKVMKVIKRDQTCVIDIKNAYQKNGIFVIKQFNIVTFWPKQEIKSKKLSNLTKIRTKDIETYVNEHGRKRNIIVQ